MTPAEEFRMVSAAARPVVGELDPSWDLFGTGFAAYNSPYGVHGLAKVAGNRLDLLAFNAWESGTGQFSRFMRACQAWYTEIVVHEIINPEVPPMLEHFGFVLDVDVGMEGPRPVMRWRATPTGATP